jgi:electron transfer flavoprotein alpha subunit
VLRDVSLELLSAALEIPAKPIGALLHGGPADVARELARYSERVIHAEVAEATDHDPALRADLVRSVIEAEEAEAVVLPHSYLGMDLAGRLAAVLDWPLLTDVTGIGLEQDRPVATRMLFGGRVEARVALPAGVPFLLSVRPTAFPAAGPLESPGEIEALRPSPPPVQPGVRFLEYVEETTEGPDITQAEILVSVGRGIGEEENIKLAAELAEALGGTLACSRPIVDRGWLPRSRQVGTSGRTVRPRVYLALGISGAFQHVAGMKGAGRVIAINRDRHAPVFKAADWGVVGDLFDVVPELTRLAREERRR